MNLQRLNIYKIIYVTLIFLLAGWDIFELHFILFLITTTVLLLNRDYKISKITFNLLLVLSFLLTIGFFSSIFYEKSTYNWFKDLLYFIKPILGIITGYLLLSKIKDHHFFLKGIVYVSLVFALLHIYNVFIHTDFSSASINKIRNTNGLSNLLELFSLVVLLVSKKYGLLQVVENRINRRIWITILSVSFVLYFSREMLVGLIIMILAINGYAKLSVKGFKYGLILLSVIGIFYIYLFAIDLKRDQPGIESFLYKMKIAPAEIFSPTVDIDIKDHKILWDHWRAYESNMAIDQMNSKPVSYLNGFGFGSLVDLKFYAPLNEEGMRYIPFLHNGYIYVLFKTGLPGLLFYLIFLMFLYVQSYKKTISLNESFIRNGIASIGLFFIFSSVITTGIYNSSELFTFILGGFLYLLSDVNSINMNLE